MASLWQVLNAKPKALLISGDIIYQVKHQMYNKIEVRSFIAGIMLTLAASCGGQDAGGSRPHFHGQAPGEKQTILRQIEGTVSAVDSKQMTLTIKSGKEERTLKVTSKTKFTRNAAPASMNDITVGKPVKVVIKMVYGQPDEIATVEIQIPMKH